MGQILLGPGKFNRKPLPFLYQRFAAKLYLRLSFPNRRRCRRQYPSHLSFPFDLPAGEAQILHCVNVIRAAYSSIFGFLLLVAVSLCGVAQTPLQTNAPVFTKVKLFDLKKDGAWVFAFCPASRDLFVSFDAETSQVVYRWNADTGRKLDSYAFPKKYRCLQAVISPDGKMLVLVAYDMLHDALQNADKVRLIDVPSGKVVKELTYDGAPARVQFSRNGRFIKTHRYTYEPGGELVYDLQGNVVNVVNSEAFNPIEEPIVWNIPNSKGGPRPGLFYRDSEGNKRKIYPSDDGYESDVVDFVVSKENRYVACSTYHGKIMIWQLPDVKLVFESKVGKRPFHLAYDSKMERFLFADGDIDKATSLWAVQR